MTENSEQQDWYSGDHATFGDRLTAAREAQGISQSQMARRLGVKLRTVEGWENDTSEPRANKLQMAAGLLNVSLRWLLTGEGDGVAEPATQEDLAEDAQTILKDMRGLRADLTRVSTELGRMEKRLRQIVKETI
ncbi:MULTISPECIES: helix-turn-helix domain-containing protein [Roseinatronobacter]|uniref:Helix-turn-helix domain-containing protein n=1 Tax=Roseinatronobacter domitianus TaxID=2940293 RepID=A0ABT0LZV3_9RHOB|nr:MULTISPECIES: helix-turn-helix transcriptional regulator [Roseibaca]MCL1628143.1 helix-turn-helix domain-containing protein [Roseibaca domitiana]